MINTEEKLNELKVVKRNGKKVDFNGSKIAVAIKKGFDSLIVEDQEPKYNEKDIQKVYQNVIKRIEKDYKDAEKIKKDYNPPIYIIGRSHERITPNFNITIENEDPTLRMFSNAVAIQMLALEIAKKLGRNVDKPKGLVKVVKEN